jgi:hypothetical protein
MPRTYLIAALRLDTCSDLAEDRQLYGKNDPRMPP